MGWLALALAPALALALMLPLGLALGLPPDDAEIEALLAAARAEREAGEMVRAAALYARVMELDPGNRVAHYNAGIILEKAGKPELAVTVWRRALAADAGDLYAWEHLVRNLAATGGLQAEIAVLTSRVEEQPGAQVPPLALALALQAADRWQESIELLETYLVEHPASNIAYTFLKDAFPTSISRRIYLEGLAARSRRPGAPEHLKLLHIRLLTELGRSDEARALAAGADWTSELARTLLARAELLRAGPRDDAGGVSQVASAAAGPSAAGEGTGEGTAAGESGPAAGGGDTTGAPTNDPALGHPRPEAPDFGPDDPRSATRHLDRSQAALARDDDSAAGRELRQALHAAPLLLQPRILLALLLEQEGRGEEARATLRGPVEVSPYDLYQQAWRTVRDDYVDPDHGGVDIYRLRRQALGRLGTVADAKEEIDRLLAALQDPYAHLFAPDLFAGYLLAPNANRLSGPREPGLGEIADPWIPIPEAEPAPAADGAPMPDASGTATADRSGPAMAGEAPGPPPAAPPSPASPRAAGGDWAGRDRTLEVKPPPDRLPKDAPRAVPRDPGVRAQRLADGLGYIAIPSLGGLAVPQQVEEALSHLDGVRGLVLDLRGNRGGDGDVAVEVAARFLPAGTEVCSYQTRRGRERRITSWENPSRPRVPLAVLVNGDTASAAELLAAALRDGAGARLVGTPSAGKGVGQKALLLGDGSGMSLSRFRILAPSGASWHGRGLQPDLAAEPGAAGGDPDAALKAARALLHASGR